jgi:hypothetical protein
MADELEATSEAERVKLEADKKKLRSDIEALGFLVPSQMISDFSARASALVLALRRSPALS